MMLTGLRVFGPELYRLGVVEQCVSPDELMEVTLDLAREIAQKSPVAIKLAKQGLNQIEEMTLRDGYRFEQNMTAEVRKSADSKEAMQAFIEKRKPIFTGK
jgi:enoyl-CoA hydratase/carnithine racemase